MQVSLFLQEGIQVDGARVALPQPLSNSPVPPVGTMTTYGPQGMHTNAALRCCVYCAAKVCVLVKMLPYYISCTANDIPSPDRC